LKGNKNPRRLRRGIEDFSRKTFAYAGEQIPHTPSFNRPRAGYLPQGRIEMTTNLAIDDNLLERALIIGGLRTKKDTVNMALDEFIQRRKR
ncbi:MAG: type II toxin-antitoxin system VapB family antitoxin, partial [Treponema sp.]|nr:type II toxin-antitoxin system VapB family antitoxin [Treponema sp.]